MPNLLDEFEAPAPVDLSAEFDAPAPVDLSAEFSLPPTPAEFIADKRKINPHYGQTRIAVPGMAPDWIDDPALTLGGKKTDLAIRVVAPIAGAIAGSVVPGAGTYIGGGAGGLAGEALAQTREAFRGERTSPSYGQLTVSTVMGAIPLGKLAPTRLFAGGRLAIAIPQAVAVRAAQGAGIGTAGSVTAQVIDEGKVNWSEVAKTAAWSTLFGAGAGGFESAAMTLAQKAALLQMRKATGVWTMSDEEFIAAARTARNGKGPPVAPPDTPPEPAAPTPTALDVPLPVDVRAASVPAPIPPARALVVVTTPTGPISVPAAPLGGPAVPADEPIDYSIFDQGGGMPATGEREDSLTDWVPKPLTPGALVLSKNVATTPDPDKYTPQQVPLSEIVVNKDIKQFKANADPVTGVVDPLGKYIPEGVAPIVLWKKLNGEKEIITGRHRFASAKDSGEKSIIAYQFNEADGFTVVHAQIYDAESNIKDGQGDIKDYAQYFRATRDLNTRAVADARGLLSRYKGSAGFSLGHDAGDGLFTLYQNGQIVEAKAVAIARGAPGNEAAQASAIRGAKQKSPAELELYARNLSRLTGTAQPAGTEQMGFGDIGGDFAAFEKEADAVAKVQAEKIRQNSELILAAQGAAKRPEAARKMGLPVEDPAALQTRVDELKAANAELHNPSPTTFEQLRREAGLTPHEDVSTSVNKTAPASVDAPASVNTDVNKAPDAGDLLNTADTFSLASEVEKSAAEKSLPVDNTPSMFGDEVKGTPPTEMDKANAAARGGVEGNIEPAPGSGIGGDLGDPSQPANNPNFTVFPIELPEAVQFARALLGGKYPAVLDKIRALKGQALGVFKHTDGLTGLASIELRADVFNLVTAAEKRLMRQHAAEYASATKAADPTVDEARVAAEKYADLYQAAFEAAKLKNPVLASKVIWHEIGHAVDWLPDKMISGRGNLFGRIASLKRFTKTILPEKPGALGELTAADRARLRREASKLAQAERDKAGIDPKQEPGVTADEILNIWRNPAARDADPGLYDFVASLNPAQKKELVRSAVRGKISDWFAFNRDKLANLTKGEKEFYAELLVEEIRKRRLFALEQMKDELRPLIAWWRGTKTMEDYFEPPAEMYAETFSVLLNNPAAVLQRAPLFYEAFFNYLAAKPEIHKLYYKIQDDIKTGTVQRERIRNLTDSWQRAEETALEREQVAGIKPFQEQLDDWRMFFDRTFGPVYRRIKQAKLTEPGLKTEGAIGNYLYRATKYELLLRRLNLEVLGALVRANLDWVELGQYMFFQHVIHNRPDIASSGGMNPKAATEAMAGMAQQLGPARYASLEQGQRTLRAIYEDLVLKPLAAANILDPQLMAILWERTFYATMKKAPAGAALDRNSIEAALEGQYGAGVSAQIYKQVGFLGEIENAATATIQKAMSLIAMTHRTVAIHEIVQFLLESGDPLIAEAEMRYNGRYREPVIRENDRIGTLVYTHGGKVMAYYVPRAIAEAFGRSDGLQAGLIGKIYRKVAAIKSLYTGWNYGFWPVATYRDIRGFARKMPEARLLFGKHAVVRYLREARAAAAATVSNRPNALGDMALQRGVVISEADTRGEDAADSTFERMLLRYSQIPETWRAKNLGALKQLEKIWVWYKQRGQVNERMVKIAGMLYMDEHFPTMSEVIKMRIIHDSAGSPNFLERGKGANLLDFGFMFYNPAKEGLRSEWRAWKRSPGEMFAKFAVYTAATTIVLWMLENDMFPDELIPAALRKRYKDMLASISEYDKSNYHCFPLFWTDKALGKVFYFRMPLEEGERLGNGLLRRSLTLGQGGEGPLSFAGGQVPGVNPIFSVGYAWLQFAVNKENPYDTFRGRAIVPVNEFDAGMGTEAMAKWSWNAAGGTLITRFGDESIYDPPKEGIEKLLAQPGISNLLGRWLKVSNRGLYETADRANAPGKAKDAALRVMGFEIIRKAQHQLPFTADEQAALLNEPYLQDYILRTWPEAEIRRLGPGVSLPLRDRSRNERDALRQAIDALPAK